MKTILRASDRVMKLVMEIEDLKRSERLKEEERVALQSRLDKYKSVRGGAYPMSEIMRHVVHRQYHGN